MAIPGDFSEFETLLEYFKARGKRTGLVTTSYMTDATPAGFGAHEPSRDNKAQIAADYLTQTMPNVLMGGGGHSFNSADAPAAGYTVFTDRAGMLAVRTSSASFLLGLFGSDVLPYEYDGVGEFPHLSEMAQVSLELLSKNEAGFFLMVEGGRIDHAGHANSIERNVHETIEFSSAVQKALDWAGKRNDTLVIVTADHETGGLTVTANNGQGKFPTVTWTSGGHSSANVPLYAWGAESEAFSGVIDNTDFFQKITAGSDKKQTPKK
jgi:alkaline phosphatase